MKNIGLKLKEKREENGLSIEEVAEDLKMRPSQITSIEEGKKDDFKDIFYLKYFIRDYAKYLGLDSEKIIDELKEETRNTFKELYNNLSEKELDEVIKQVNEVLEHIEYEETFSVIGKELNMSASKVSNIYYRAVEKCRKAVKKNII